MVKQRINRAKKKTLSVILTVLATSLYGCTFIKPAEVPSPESKRITDMVISENSESLFFTIEGNQPLTYTVTKQVAPRGVLLQFSDTELGIGKGDYSPPENNIILSISAEEVIEDKTPTSSIFVALKRDTPYDLTPDEDGLTVSFPKASVLSKDIKPQKKVETQKPESTPTEKRTQAANLLKAVTAEPLADHIIINVESDGTIINYKSFTMNNPARVVLDLYDIQSPYDREKKITVDSEWVKQIRYCGHPGKVRLVLETHKEYLSNYSTHPTDTGLQIHVGNK